VPVVVIEVNVNVVNGVTATASLAKPSLADTVDVVGHEAVEVVGTLLKMGKFLIVMLILNLN
jgi:hypothetical protein